MSHEKAEVLFTQSSPISKKTWLFWKVVRLYLFVLLVRAAMYTKMSVGHRWDGSDRGKPKYWRNTYHSATLSTTNLTRPDTIANPRVCG